MLHAAAMLAGTFLIVVLVAPTTSGATLLTSAGAIAVFCVAWAMRFGGVWRGYGAVHAVAATLGAQLRDAFTGALRTVRLAAGARVRVTSSLLRIKPRFASDLEQTLFAAALGASAGRVVVESTHDGVLAHLLDEPSTGEAAFSQIEARVRRGFGRKELNP